MNMLIEVKNMFGESVVCSVTIIYLGYIILQFGRRSVQCAFRAPSTHAWHIGRKKSPSSI